MEPKVSLASSQQPACWDKSELKSYISEALRLKKQSPVPIW
jgi:hypothetical protein